MEVESSNSPGASPKPSPFTPAERIAELNAIDESITTLLSAASDAIGIISNNPTSETQERTLRNSSTARAAFQEAATTYFTTLSSIDVRLRRQVYALEEAGLVKPGDERDPRRGKKIGGDVGIARLGGGPLDPSWLNARASDKVGAGMKEQLLAQAREFVEKSDALSSRQEQIQRRAEGENATEDLDQDMG